MQFLCPECGHGVRLRSGYFRVLYLLSALLTSLVAYAVGIRGDTLFWTVCIFLAPTYILIVFITMRLFPPDVESTGEYRGILYGAVRGDDLRAALESPRNSREQKRNLSSASATGSETHAPLFERGSRHRVRGTIRPDTFLDLQLNLRPAYAEARLKILVLQGRVGSIGVQPERPGG